MTGVPQPRVLVLAGPNGAGKTTVSRARVRDQFGICTFVNADTIAQGLAGFSPDAAAIAAGRLMLRQLEALADGRADFAFETTLASRSFAPWLAGLRKKRVQLFDPATLEPVAWPAGVCDDEPPPLSPRA